VRLGRILYAMIHGFSLLRYPRKWLLPLLLWVFQLAFLHLEALQYHAPFIPRRCHESLLMFKRLDTCLQFVLQVKDYVTKTHSTGVHTTTCLQVLYLFFLHFYGCFQRAHSFRKVLLQKRFSTSIVKYTRIPFLPLGSPVPSPSFASSQAIYANEENTKVSHQICQ
jgi:hypothetical protein